MSQVDVDPMAEETKGGCGHVAKALFSYGTDRVGVVVYVPTELQVCWRQLGLERRIGSGSFYEFPTQDVSRLLLPSGGLVRILHTQ